MKMNRTNIGIVGLNFGRLIAEQIRTGRGKKYFEVAALCDADFRKAKESAEKMGVKAYPDIDTLLADAEIPAIGLFTGPAGRAGLIRKIIRAGKDVMTTKPFELDAEEAMSVLKEAEKAGRIVHMNSPSPLLSPDLRQIKEWTEKYDLGRPVACRCDTWASYMEKADGSWYDDPEKCPVAPVFRLGIYLINDLVRLFGKAEEVCVMHSRIITERPTPDNAQLGILFKNGVLANIFASFCIKDSQYYKNSLVLNYERGTIYRNEGPLEYNSDGICRMSLVRPEGHNGAAVEHARPEGMSGDYQWEAFFRAVNGEKFTAEITSEEIVEGVKIINAMAKADKTGRTVKV
mgnify:CR=1 FL=1